MLKTNYITVTNESNRYYRITSHLKYKSVSSSHYRYRKACRIVCKVVVVCCTINRWIVMYEKPAQCWLVLKRWSVCQYMLFLKIVLIYHKKHYLFDIVRSTRLRKWLFKLFTSALIIKFYASFFFDMLNSLLNEI